MADMKAVNAAMHRPEEDLLRDWYDDQMREVVGRKASDLLSAPGDLRSLFLTWLQGRDLHSLLCQDWDYCAKRNSYQDPTFLAAAIADLLLASSGIAAPVNVAVLVVKHYFDQVCQCAERPA